MLRSVLKKEDLELVRNIAKTANAYGYSVYLVGGIVRDILLGNAPKDIDMVVVGDAFVLSSMLKERLFCRIVKSQPELKTVKLEFRKDLAIDFASSRKEFYGAKKGIPLASHFGCPLKEDVMRRDFSINALAISINSHDFGKIIDFVGGQEDLNNKIIKVLHDKSFEDDPTRILRAMKFAYRLGFKLDEKTQKLQDDYLENRDYSQEVSLTRVKAEMFQILETNSVDIIQEFIDKKVYKILSDKINKVNIGYVKELIEKYNIAAESIPFIYFISIYFNEANYELFNQLNLTRQELKTIHDLKFTEKLDGKISDLEIYQQYSIRSKESLLLELLLKNNNNIKKYLESYTNVQIQITGQDLLLMGVPESRNFSLIFDKVLEEKIKGNLPDKKSELRFVRKLLLNNEV